jgi:hypothetical protein
MLNLEGWFPLPFKFWLHYFNFVSNPAFMILHNVQVSNLLF